MHYLETLKNKITNLPEEGIKISNQGGEFTVKPVLAGGLLEGVNVDNLGNYPFLPIDVFLVVITLLEVSESAKKGSAMSAKLGEQELGINTIEGLVAKIIYGKKLGDTVFRRITPISRILEWSGVCTSQDGYLTLIR